jgi:nitroimidazol reductase NimA-like FMN-containing flavoprotein (pyridoxamine 5'-phosphate oxidase superfamily)
VVRRNLRHERGARFLELDAQWMRATGQGRQAEVAAIEKKRQALRDAPADPRIDAARNLEQLKAIGLPEA